MNEPHRDYSKAASRLEMQEAIGKVRAQMGHCWESPHQEFRLTGLLMESRNPAHPDEVVALVQGASGEDVEKAVELAATSAVEWRDRPASERVAVMRRAAALMRERRRELAAWEIIEVSKPWREADVSWAEYVSAALAGVASMPGKTFITASTTNKPRIFPAKRVIPILHRSAFESVSVAGEALGFLLPSCFSVDNVLENMA